MDDFWTNNDDDEPDWFQKDDDDNDGDDDGGGGQDGGDDNENTNSSGGSSSTSGTHHILLLVDCDAIMFTTKKNNDSSLSTSYMNDCLCAIQSVIRNKIRTVTIYKAGKRDGIGLVLYNTKYRIPTTTTVDNNNDNDENDEDDDNDDDDDDEDLLYRNSSHHKLQPPTNVHELIPLEPPGVSTMERIQSCLTRSSDTTKSFTTSYLDIEQEYSNAATSNNSNDTNISTPPMVLPPLLLALRKAIAIYNAASCIKKTRTTSVGKFEEPDMKHIYIITPYDNPIQYNIDDNVNTDTNASTRQQQIDEYNRLLRECITDIKENDIQIHVWPIIIPDSVHCNKFDTSIFYDTIATDSISSDSMTAEEWVQQLNAVYKKTRPAYRVPFLLPNWKDRYPSSSNIATNNSTDNKQQLQHALYLDFYSVHQAQREPSVVYIHQSTGKPLGKVRQLLSLDDGGGHILAEQRSFDKTFNKNRTMVGNTGTTTSRKLGTFFEFGDEYIPFSLRDKVLLKRQCNVNPNFASLILIGFKPSDSVPFYHTVEKSYFAYPSDPSTSTSGNTGSNNSTSIDTIAHLHASMIRNNVIGIGELLTRTTATSRLVAIRPIPEILRRVSTDTNSEGNSDDNDDEVYMLVRPPGLLISALPFEDEMRIPSTLSQNIPEVPEDIIQATMNLIEKQTFDDDVTIGVDFTNAAMDRFWNYIERIAYNEDCILKEQDDIDNVQYDTEINSEKVLEQFGNEIDALRLLLPEAVQPDKVVSSSRGGGQKRKAPVAQQSIDESGVDWWALVNDGNLSKCTVPDLKSKLRSIGEAVNGNKAVLVERLENYFASMEPPPAVKKESDVAVKVEENYL